MKKTIFILILVTMFVLSACKNTDISNNEMTITESKFSEETQNILEIFDDEIMFLDYTLDETVKSSSINLWSYKNGDWIEIGNISGNIGYLENQIGIRLMETGFDLFTINENGHVKYSYPEIETEFSNSDVVTLARISEPTKIELNEEISLWAKLGTDKNMISIHNPRDFRYTDCTEGVAITITFSDKDVE